MLLTFTLHRLRHRIKDRKWVLPEIAGVGVKLMQIQQHRSAGSSESRAYT
jgi:hypothetical protein